MPQGWSASLISFFSWWNKENRVLILPILDTRIVTPKPARKNASKEAIALARKRFRRRAGIEPVIGHLKSDHRLKRNFLKGFEGDQINLLMAAAAFNFKKWLRAVNIWPQYLKLILQALIQKYNLQYT
jgi:hypothetical protein